MSAPTSAMMAPVPSANTNSNDVPPPPRGATRPSSSDGDPVGDFSAQSEEDASRIGNLKFVNATSFLLTGMMVVGVVLFGAREEGVFGDEFLWMKYQTLLTPSPYVNLVWIPIFVLQGLFVYASTLHATMQFSPLVGYERALTSPSASVAAHYPAVCAATLAMTYSHDYGHIGFAFLFAVLCGVVLRRVLDIQGEVLSEMEGGESLQSGAPASDVRSRAFRYAALRLPFELHGGYALALAAVYLNTFLSGFESLPASAYLAAANVSLLSLLCAGFALLWRTERKSYGAGLALVWYLLGVAIELGAPTQPIYNEFSDGAILATQVVAGVASLVLATLLGVRVMKTMIKHNVLNCADALDGEDNVSDAGGGEIATGYVHA